MSQPGINPFELAELDQVVKNGQIVAGQLAAMGRYANAGAVDALCRTVQILRARLTVAAAPAAVGEQLEADAVPKEGASG